MNFLDRYVFLILLGGEPAHLKAVVAEEEEGMEEVHADERSMDD